jgi:feruloyl esterase
MVAGAVVSMFAAMPAQAQVTTCESLAGVSLPGYNNTGNTTITVAQTVTSGSVTLSYWNPITTSNATQTVTGLPPMCRVAGVTKPGPNSSVNWEVWLPAANWIGRYQQVGGGGLGGATSFRYADLGAMVQKGYAVASNDQGNDGDASHWVNSTDKQLDFEYRAYPLTHDNAMALMQAYYGKGPKKSYIVGCSEGGREGLLMAQRYPTYFDGIVSGSPAMHPSHMWVGNLWLGQFMLNSANVLSAAQIQLIMSSSTNACKDAATGVVTDPRKCTWDPASLLCSDPNNSTSGSCLSAPQVASVKAFMGPNGGAHNPRTGKLIFPGWNVFSSLDGLLPIVGTPFQLKGLFGLYFNNMNYDWTKYNLDTDQATLDASTFAANIDATNPDLSAFAARGGKLVLWAGWEDTSISPYDSMNYYESVIRQNASAGDRQILDLAYENPEYPANNTTAKEFLSSRAKALALQAAQAARARAIASTNQFAQYYMAQGVQHCLGGPGAQSFVDSGTQQYGELVQAVENWVEAGIAPDAITISKHTNNDPTKAVQFTTKLCPYPKSLIYTGSGSQLSASNYVCQ